MTRRLLFVLSMLLLLGLVGYLVYDEYSVARTPQAEETTQAPQKPEETAAPAVYSFMTTREHDGKVYEARNASSLTTVLLIGYDHVDNGELTEAQDSYIRGGQSDFLLLLAIDHENRTVRPLQINRDTMTNVRYYNKKGDYYGTRKLQICLSHAYGDTQEKNNRNTIWAVENLLGIGEENDGAQIDWYLAMDISGIGRLNDLLGGVTVPLVEDFTYYDPTMVKGGTMTLQGAQAEVYCRQRYHIGDQSNENRMARQRIYMDAAIETLRKQLGDSPNFAQELLNGMGLIFDTVGELDSGFGFTTDAQGTPITDTPTHYLMTNTSLKSIVALLARVKDYEVLAVENLPGTNQIGASGYMEYIVETNAGLSWALDALYRPVQ